MIPFIARLCCTLLLGALISSCIGHGSNDDSIVCRTESSTRTASVTHWTAEVRGVNCDYGFEQGQLEYMVYLYRAHQTKPEQGLVLKYVSAFDEKAGRALPPPAAVWLTPMHLGIKMPDDNEGVEVQRAGLGTIKVSYKPR